MYFKIKYFFTKLLSSSLPLYVRCKHSLVLLPYNFILTCFCSRLFIFSANLGVSFKWVLTGFTHFWGQCPSGLLRNCTSTLTVLGFCTRLTQLSFCFTGMLLPFILCINDSTGILHSSLMCCSCHWTLCTKQIGHNLKNLYLNPVVMTVNFMKCFKNSNFNQIIRE